MNNNASSFQFWRPGDTARYPYVEKFLEQLHQLQFVTMADPPSAYSARMGSRVLLIIYRGRRCRWELSMQDSDEEFLSYTTVDLLGRLGVATAWLAQEVLGIHDKVIFRMSGKSHDPSFADCYYPLLTSALVSTGPEEHFCHDLGNTTLISRLAQIVMSESSEIIEPIFGREDRAILVARSMRKDYFRVSLLSNRRLVVHMFFNDLFSGAEIIKRWLEHRTVYIKEDELKE